MKVAALVCLPRGRSCVRIYVLGVSWLLKIEMFALQGHSRFKGRGLLLRVQVRALGGNSARFSAVAFSWSQALRCGWRGDAIR
eukprot:6831371-Alexandrium_andersonii.AAC.1